MKIFTSVLLDWKGNIIESESFEYFGPIAKCDRSLTNDAEQAQKTAVQTAGNYQAAGQGIQQSLVPRLEQQAVNPTGFGAFGLGEMETGAEQTAAGASGAAAEQARLRANRTGNAASLGSVQAAGAGEGRESATAEAGHEGRAEYEGEGAARGAEACEESGSVRGVRYG